MADLLDGARLDLRDPRAELVVDALALGFAHALNEDLFCRLYGVAAEVGEVELLEDHRAELRPVVDNASIGELNLKLGVVDLV